MRSLYIAFQCGVAVLLGAAPLCRVLCADAVAEEPSEVSWNAFIDATIAHDFNHLPTRYRPYTTQPYYSDEGALNLGFVDATLDTPRYHGRLAIQYGSSVIANYADEPHLFMRYLQEAFVGAKISDSLTIDGGIFFSHIGLENWISRDNYTVTRSLVSDYSPYYQMGIRSTYEVSDDVRAQLHVIRGWQNVTDDEHPAIGTQLSFDLSRSTNLTHNFFWGEIEGSRFFNNVVLRYDISPSLGLGACYDVGVQERRDEETAIWHGGSIISHYKVSDTVAVAGRVEFYSDPHQVIIQGVSGEHFSATGFSLNVDYTIATGLLWRNEYRVLMSSRDVFPERDEFSRTDTVVTSSLLYTL